MFCIFLHSILFGGDGDIGSGCGNIGGACAKCLQGVIPCLEYIGFAFGERFVSLSAINLCILIVHIFLWVDGIPFIFLGGTGGLKGGAER